MCYDMYLASVFYLYKIIPLYVSIHGIVQFILHSRILNLRISSSKTAVISEAILGLTKKD